MSLGYEDVEVALLLFFCVGGLVVIARWASHSRRRAILVSLAVVAYVIAFVVRYLRVSR